ncbi:phage holin family protein, partial [Salmonella sp. S043_49643]
MELNDPTATINALLCACVVITLMFYRRGDSRHRPWVSRLAWLITVTYSAVPLA